VTERPHGTRARYVWGPKGVDPEHGCRCFECSSASVLYEKRRIAARRRGEAPFVDAEPARTHIMWLSAQGVGMNSVTAASGVGRTTILQIKNRQLRKIRPATARKILRVGVDAAQPRSRIPAGPTLAQLDDLVNVLGMTKRAVAAELGRKYLAIGRASTTVTKANADAVDALWRRKMAPRLAARQLVAHRQAVRQAPGG
jgi:hypothetical protein